MSCLAGSGEGRGQDAFSLLVWRLLPALPSLSPSHNPLVCCGVSSSFPEPSPPSPPLPFLLINPQKSPHTAPTPLASGDCPGQVIWFSLLAWTGWKRQMLLEEPGGCFSEAPPQRPACHEHHSGPQGRAGNTGWGVVPPDPFPMLLQPQQLARGAGSRSCSKCCLQIPRWLHSILPHCDGSHLTTVDKSHRGEALPRVPSWQVPGPSPRP